jgi:hypothetical protein
MTGKIRKLNRLEAVRRQRRRTIALLCGALALTLVGLRIAAIRRASRVRVRHAPVNGPVRPRYPDPPGIVLHDSDTPAIAFGHHINAAQLEAIHAHDHPNWATVFEGKTYHIGYHYVILPDGKIEQGRPDHCPGCHTKKHNNWLGICVVGAFSTNRHWWPSSPTHAQVASVISLCKRLMAKYHIPLSRVKRHRDLRDTWCPGDRFPYRTILAALRPHVPAGREIALAAPHAATAGEREMDDAEDRPVSQAAHVGNRQKAAGPSGHGKEATRSAAKS